MKTQNKNFFNYATDTETTDPAEVQTVETNTALYGSENPVTKNSVSILDSIKNNN